MRPLLCLLMRLSSVALSVRLSLVLRPVLPAQLTTVFPKKLLSNRNILSCIKLRKQYKTPAASK